MKYRHIIGLMSGTSLDGIDVALIKVEGFSTDVKYELLHYDSFSYSEEIQERILKQSFVETSDVASIMKLHMDLGKLTSETVQTFLRNIDFKESIDAIGYHGQTIHHLPKEATMQIGSAATLAYDLETIVVSNFREMDIVAKGDGAPLVPYTDYLMFGNKEGIILQNIGGIANATLIEKDALKEDVVAYDSGPGNMMVNFATNYFFNEPFDNKGLHASKGKLIKPLYDELMAHPYLKLTPPKSTGREAFGEDLTRSICMKYQDRPNDVIHTLSLFTVASIADAYHRFSKGSIEKMIVSGGGAYNKFMIHKLKETLDIPVLTLEDLKMSSDAKEAIAFALLANETLNFVANNMPSATGAQDAIILGQITLNPKMKGKGHGFFR